ncbi:enamelin [Hemicordylus capensis]|uniref:enamelin n=1 Tax=Hemicordylus capensis TaxID=884348 RepID=UPI002304641B|nr:enamelin [Hemicordylus capensis]
MFEQDFEKPKEKEAPKESPAADPATNATAPDTNSTTSNVPGQGGNVSISGLSATGNGANSPGPESRLLSGNGIPTPSPTVHVSGSDGTAQSGINQSNYKVNSPNVNDIQSFPSGNQQSIGHGLHVYKSPQAMGDIRHKTLTSRGNPSGQPENPTYRLGYGDNSNHRGPLQNTNSNHPSINTRLNPYGQQEQPYYPGRAPPDQRGKVQFTNSDPQSQWNNDPVYRDSGLNNSPPEGHSLDSQFNILGQGENVYNRREDTDQFQPSGKHQSSPLSHHGVFSATKTTPSETETRPYGWKEQTFNPSDYEREQLPPLQTHMWNKLEDLPQNHMWNKPEDPRQNHMWNKPEDPPQNRMWNKPEDPPQNWMWNKPEDPPQNRMWNKPEDPPQNRMWNKPEDPPQNRMWNKPEDPPQNRMWNKPEDPPQNRMWNKPEDPPQNRMWNKPEDPPQNRMWNKPEDPPQNRMWNKPEDPPQNRMWNKPEDPPQNRMWNKPEDPPQNRMWNKPEDPPQNRMWNKPEDPPQNRMWNKPEDSQVFQEDPRYNAMYSSNSFGPKGHVPYSEKNSYLQHDHSFYPGAWEGRENSPTLGPAGQRESQPYSPMLPSNQMQRNSYHRTDPFFQQEHSPRQNPWTTEKHMLDLDRQYRNPPYNPPQHNAYPKYPTANPANQRGNVQYEEINQWAPEEHSPVYGAKEPLGQAESFPHRVNNMIGHRERNMQSQGSNSPLQSTTTLLQGGSQYPERDTWGPQMVGPSAQKEITPYFNTYSTDFRKNPTHAKDTGGIMHERAHISSVDAAERQHYSDILGYPDDYRRELRTIPPCLTLSDLCCAGDSTVPRQNILAPLRSAPQIRLASWEQRGSLAYPESSHSKHTRQVPYPADIQPNHKNTSLKAEREMPNQRETLGSFGEEVAGPPCPKSHLGQLNEYEANHEAGLPSTRNAPCVRGDRHNILAQNTETDSFQREFERAAPIKLVPEKILPPEGMKSAALGSEDNRKEQYATFGFKRSPCFGSQLKYLSSTGAPSGDKHYNLLYADNPMPTGKPGGKPPEPQPISNTQPPHDVEEKLLESNLPGEDLADQPNARTPDCLLLQNK